jgi:hypothetical protein
MNTSEIARDPLPDEARGGDGQYRQIAGVAMAEVGTWLRQGAFGQAMAASPACAR